MTKNGRSNAMRRMPYMTSFANYDIASIMRKTDQFEYYLDRKIKQMEKKKMKKEDCAEYLNSVVEEYISQLTNELEIKHYTLCKKIRDAFVGRAADKKELKEIVNSLDEKIGVTKDELEMVKQLYKEFNPIRNGEIQETPAQMGRGYTNE